MLPVRRTGNYVLTPRTYAPSGWEPAAFKETAVSGSGISTGYVTAWEADNMIRRAALKGRPVKAREYGALHIEGRRMGRTLEMVIDPRRLTPRQTEDLELIAECEHHAELTRDQEGRVTGIAMRFLRIGKVQASILLERGWLTTPPHSDRVWVSAAGRMAMAYALHRQERLHWRVLKGLYSDAALTAANRTGLYYAEPRPAPAA